jgi:hypothetical protein
MAVDLDDAASRAESAGWRDRLGKRSAYRASKHLQVALALGRNLGENGEGTLFTLVCWQALGNAWAG